MAVCYATLLGRLWFLGLASRYRVLCAYLAVQAIGSLGLSWIPIRTYAYTYAYMCVTPVLWVLAWMVVLELCRLILEDYPGIAGEGRRIVTWSMAAGVLISAVIAVYGLIAGVGRYPFMRSFLIVHFSVRAGVFAFLMAILFFVFRFRLRLPRNRRIYGIGFAVCWGLELVADGLSRVTAAPVAEVLDSVEMVFCSALLIAGFFLIGPEGERMPPARDPDTDETRAALHRKMADINRLLLKVSNREK